MRFTEKARLFQIKCSPAIYDDFQILGTTLAFHCTLASGIKMHSHTENWHK